MKYAVLTFIMLKFFVETSLCYAAIYMQKLNHHITYSDIAPSPSAVQIDLTEYSNTASEKIPEVYPVKKKISDTVSFFKPYTFFQIAYPKDQETITNQPEWYVDVLLQPALRENNKLQVFLDNTPVSVPQYSTHFSLKNVVRGSHELYVVILDQNSVAKQRTNTITVYVHKANIGIPVPPPAPIPTNKLITMLTQLQL